MDNNHGEIESHAPPCHYSMGGVRVGIDLIKEKAGIGYCNITKCCTEVCPEHIHITDNAIIPLKERVADRYYDPIAKLLGLFSENK